MQGKKIFLSKTFWANIVALVAMIIQGVTGKQFMDLQAQGTILALINIILRAVTKEPIVWKT